MNVRAILSLGLLFPLLACGSKTEAHGNVAPDPSHAGAGDDSDTGGAPTSAGGSKNSAGAKASGGAAGQGGKGTSGGAGSGNGGDGAGGAQGGAVSGGAGGAEGAICEELGSSCSYSSECCSHFCSEQTHTCKTPNYCPISCAAGTYCRPGFNGDDNTCQPAPRPQCAADSPQAACNRCIVEHCPAEVVYCSCDHECFGQGGGCLPVCGNTDFAGFNECADANCAQECD